MFNNQAMNMPATTRAPATRTWAALPWRPTAPFCAPLVAVADADVESPPVFDGRVELPRVPEPEFEAWEAVTVAELLTVSVELPSPWSSVVVEPYIFRTRNDTGCSGGKTV